MISEAIKSELNYNEIIYILMNCFVGDNMVTLLKTTGIKRKSIHKL